MFLENLRKNSRKDNNHPKVGVITNYFSEQLIARDFETEMIPYDNYKEVLEENDFEMVFLDDKIYEIDHSWYGRDYDDILSVIDKSSIRLIVITSSIRPLLPELEKYFKWVIDPFVEEVTVKSNEIIMPPMLDEKVFNPADNTLVTDILYLNLGNISHYESFSNYHKKFKPKIKEVEMNGITRENIQDLVKAIKSSNVFYIYHSHNVDITFIKYLETISILQNTIVMLDESFDMDSKYSVDLEGIEAFVDYKRTVVNSTLFRDKYIIKKTREAFLANTLVTKLPLSELLSSPKNKNVIDNQPVKISVIVATKRKANLEHIASFLRDQKHVHIQTILLTHGFKLRKDEKESFRNQANTELKVVSQSEKVSFGKCLNQCIRHVKYDYVTKMDDDDYYFPSYLIDIWLGLKYSGYTLVGKNAFFFYLEKEKLTGQRRMQKQYKKVTEVKGNTLLCTTKTMKKYKFEDLPRHVDSDFIQRIKKDGGRVYSIHPYDMCVHRANDKSGHTYQVDDSRFLRDADVLYYGPPNETISSD